MRRLQAVHAKLNGLSFSLPGVSDRDPLTISKSLSFDRFTSANETQICTFGRSGNTFPNFSR